MNRCQYCGTPCRDDCCYAHRDLAPRDPLTLKSVTTATGPAELVRVEKRGEGVDDG